MTARLVAALTAGGAAMVMAAAPAVATGPEGAVVSPAAHVCSSEQAAGPSCTYTSTVPGGWQGSGFTLVATHTVTVNGVTTTVTDINLNCPAGTPCSTGQENPIPVGDTVTVTSIGGIAAV